MSVAVQVHAAGRTHVGLVRRRNEDALHLGGSLLAVADGLGGHIAGDVASATAIEALRAHDHAVDPGNLARALGTAVADADAALRRRIVAAPELAGMGTTLVALLRSGAVAVLANVGDSRAYLLRADGSGRRRTVQITEDHTYGKLVADAATVPGLPPRLARFLDGRPDGRSPDITRWRLRPDDRFLLCTDGLSSVVSHEAIHAALSAADSPDETADRLVALAMDRGGPDNITVIVVDVRAAADAPSGSQHGLSRRPPAEPGRPVAGSAGAPPGPTRRRPSSSSA